MRLWTAVTIAVAAQLVVGTALAAGGTGGKGETGGKGGPGPGGGPKEGGGASAGAAAPGSGGSTDQQLRRSSTTPELLESQKPWAVGVEAEFHRLIRQNDLGGAGSYKDLAVYGAYVRYDVTDDDRFTLREYLSQKFIADEGETGLRLDDLLISYRHRLVLPDDAEAYGILSNYFGTSFASQKSSLIVQPNLTLGATKKWGYFTLDARASGGAFVVHYSTAEGGSPNPKWRAAISVSAEMQMPFHDALSVGIDGGDRYTWYYDVRGTQPPGMSNYVGVVVDTTFPNQPMQQSYGGEVFVRYTFPEFSGIYMDATAAFAQGDPSIGYNSALHEGVAHAYFFVRQTSEIYGVLSARY